MDVIKFILTEQDAINLGEEGLTILSTLNTETVMNSITKYINSPAANPEVVKLIRKCYSNSLGLSEMRYNEGLMESIKLVEGLTPNDITADLPVEELQSYKKAIEEFMGCDFATPYKAPVKSAAFNEVLLNLYKIDGRVASKIEAGKNIFKDPHNSRSVSTPCKRASYNMGNINIISHGIDFLLESLSQHSPVAWRHL